jgi:hypothetical protein
MSLSLHFFMNELKNWSNVVIGKLGKLNQNCSHDYFLYYKLLTYSIYFSYTVFLTDYKKILKIAGGVKQLTVPLLPDPNCSMPENDAQCVIPVKCCISFKTMLCSNFFNGMVC